MPTFVNLYIDLYILDGRYYILDYLLYYIVYIILLINLEYRVKKNYYKIVNIFYASVPDNRTYYSLFFPSFFKLFQAFFMP